MKRIKLLTCLTLALALIFGNSLTAYASEITDEETAVRDEDNIFYDPNNQIGDDGKYHYFVNALISVNSETGAYLQEYFEIISSHPLVCYTDGYTEGDSFQQYYIGNRFQTYSDGITKEIRLANGTTNGVTYSIEKIGFSQSVDENGALISYSDTLNVHTHKWAINMQYGMTGSFTTSIPMFIGKESAINYLETMDDSEATNKKPSSVFDNEIGYLHGLEYDQLITYTEDGAPTEAYYQFTWEKFYENYDSTYSVEVWAVCNLEQKKFFGLGSSVVKVSDREYIKTVPYVSLDGDGNEKCFLEITNSELNAIFQPFWSADEKLFETRAWNYDYYLRIVKDSKYGPWTIYDHEKGPLTGDTLGNIYVGSEDESGNVIIDSSTEYGEGITIRPSVGGGTNKDEANDDLLEGDSFETSDVGKWFTWLYDTFQSLINALGQFPQLVGQIFTFLPTAIITLLCAVIVMCVVLRLIGR